MNQPTSFDRLCGELNNAMILPVFNERNRLPERLQL